MRRLDLAAIAKYPLVTYDFAFRKGSKIQRAFEAAGLTPRVVLTSTDPRIIKTYVCAGLGIGLIASIAFDKADGRRLRLLDASRLFESSITTIGIHRNSYITRYMYDFIGLVLPRMDRAAIDAMMAGDVDSARQRWRRATQAHSRLRIAAMAMLDAGLTTWNPRR